MEHKKGWRRFLPSFYHFISILRTALGNNISSDVNAFVSSKSCWWCWDLRRRQSKIIYHSSYWSLRRTSMWCDAPCSRISHSNFWELKCYLVLLVRRVNGFVYGLQSDNGAKANHILFSRFSFWVDKQKTFVQQQWNPNFSFISFLFLGVILLCNNLRLLKKEKLLTGGVRLFACLAVKITKKTIHIFKFCHQLNRQQQKRWRGEIWKVACEKK